MAFIEKYILTGVSVASTKAVDWSTSSSVDSVISSSGYKEYNNVSNNKFDKYLMNYKETCKLTVDMTGVVFSSLVSSTVGTVGTVKGSASTSSWFKMTSSISGIETDEVISSCSINGPDSMVAISSSFLFLRIFFFLFLPSLTFVILLFLSLFGAVLFSLPQLSFSFFFFFLFS